MKEGRPKSPEHGRAIRLLIKSTNGYPRGNNGKFHGQKGGRKFTNMQENGLLNKWKILVTKEGTTKEDQRRRKFHMQENMVSLHQNEQRTRNSHVEG